MRYLIVNADDFGYSRSVNRGILEAHDRGIVTSTSLMVERPAAADAAAEAARRPGLGVGLHLELARWHVSLLPRRGAARSAERVARSVEADVRRQLELFGELTGRRPTHLDSHQHRHTTPLARPVVEQIANELAVPLRRVTPWVRFHGEFYGHDGRGERDAGSITVESLVHILESIDDGVTELCCHPGYIEDLNDWYRVERLQEVQTLCDARVRESVERLELRLCTFHEAGTIAAVGDPA